MTDSYAVDPTALLAAGEVLATTARLAHGARGTAARAGAGEGWALDGALPAATDRFVATLDAALGRLVDDAREAAALLALAASRYAQAERAATAPGAPDAGSGASRDAWAAPRG
jgi:hypothetical protein